MRLLNSDMSLITLWDEKRYNLGCGGKRSGQSSVKGSSLVRHVL
jgi:hypothetical protein